MKNQVCGQTVLYNDERDFELCASYLNQLEFFEDESKRLSILRQVAARNGCRLTSRWNTLVHARRDFSWLEIDRSRGRLNGFSKTRRCAVRSSTCDCWIPIGAPCCKLHPSVPSKKRNIGKERKRWGRMLDSDPEDEPAAPVKPPAPITRRPEPREPDSGCEQGSAEGSREPSPVPLIPILRESIKALPAAKEKPAGWSSLLVRMKPDAPKGSLKRKPTIPVKKAPPPPEKKTYSDGAGEPQKRAWLPREEWLAQRKRESQGADGFDIQVHGYWLTKARGLVYRCPDGREFPATGVDSFDTRAGDSRQTSQMMK